MKTAPRAAAPAIAVTAFRPAIRRHAFACLCRAAWLGAALTAAPMASTAQTAARSAAQDRSRYDIPAGPVASTAMRFAGEAGVTLSFDPALAQDGRSAGLRGVYGVEEGFAALLAGSGLEAVREAGGYRLRASAVPQGARTLSPVIVSAQADSAWASPTGYRATRGASASKMDVPVIETPQRVSTIGQDQIRDQAISSVAEAVRYSAGVRGYDYGVTDDDVIVRGISLTGTGLYRDGMRLMQNGFMTNIEPYGLERLDVVHGPASVLYGQAAPGGLLNAVTKRPRAESLREVGIEVGSFDRRQITADIGGAVNEAGNVLARLTVLKRDAGTQWDYLDANRTYVAPALTWVGEDTRVTLLAQYQKDDTGFIIPYYRNTPFGPSRASINVNGPDGFHEKETISAGYLVEHEFGGGLKLRHNLRYLDGTNLRQEMRNRGLGADGRSMVRLAMLRPDGEHTLVTDTQLEGNFTTGSARHQMIVGLDYYRSKLDWQIRSLNGRVAPLDLLQPVYIRPNWQDSFLSDRAMSRNEQVGVYVQDQIKVGERWVLSLAGRHDSARIDSTYDTRLTAGGPTSTARVNRTDEAFTGRAGLIYLAPNGLAPYLSYTTAFQPPLGTTTATDQYGQPYEPEEGKQIELGVRYAPAHADYSVSAAIYDLRKTNVRTPSQIDPRFDLQTGEVRSRGLELEGSGELGGGFSVIAAYTYLDAKVTRSNLAYEVGTQRAANPRHAASLWGKYRRDKLELGVGVRHISSAPGDVAQPSGPVPHNDGYTLVDAMAAYQLGKWRLSLNVGNLFDKQYKTQCNVMRGGASFCVLGYERDVRLGATYRF